jgi:hypothetical protein
MRGIINACKIWFTVINLAKLTKYLGIIWILIGIYDLITSQFIKEKVPKIVDILPDWGWQYWIIIALTLLLIITIEGLYRKDISKAKGNWIAQYKLLHGELPSIPEYILPVVIKYEKGKPISKEIELITMSGQYWNNLLPSQREQLKSLVEWLGMNWDDYLEQMRRSLPPKPIY